MKTVLKMICIPPDVVIPKEEGQAAPVSDRDAGIPADHNNTFSNPYTIVCIFSLTAGDFTLTAPKDLDSVL